MKKISDKRRQRLAWYSEKDLFKELRESREHKCMICWHYTDLTQAQCFAHVLDKWMYPKYRTHPENIALVCTISCHNKVDYLASWHAYIIEYMLKSWACANDIIDYLKESACAKQT